MDMECADVVLDILRHLPLRSLAASRCVCTAWRALIDDHRLLRADLLPLSLDAVIYETSEPDAPQLFSRSSTSRTITSGLDYLDVKGKQYLWPMLDHCNGLLLLDDNIVVNPATRQWAKLPPLPHSCTATGCTTCRRDRYLVYDPAVSPHYDMLLIPRIPTRTSTDHKCCYESVSAMEWPPSPYIISVFSSSTRCWKERSFIREGDAAGVVDDLKFPGMSPSVLFYSAYWQRALYVRWQYAFLLRINLANDTYQVIKLPRGKEGAPRLGKSKDGVYCSLVLRRCRCEIWFLDESSGQMNWVLRNEINLEHVETKCSVADGPWVFQSCDEMEWLLNNQVNFNDTYEGNKALPQDDFGWDSDDENVVSTADWPIEYCGYNPPCFYCLGFHPYKQIVLFHDGSQTTIAYHFNSSKVQYLGKMWIYHEEIEASFAYTPCWTRDLPGSNKCQ
ncbi:unnamed protein product [Alopecurus aequalis]